MDQLETLAFSTNNIDSPIFFTDSSFDNKEKENSKANQRKINNSPLMS